MGLMSWELLTAISVITFSVSVLVRRLLLNTTQKLDPFVYVVAFQGLVGLITGIYALMHGFVMPDLDRYGLMMAITIGLYAAAHLVSVKAFELVEASVFSVLFATGTLWTMAASLFLFDDRITGGQLLGVMLLLVSVAILVERKQSWRLSRGIWLGLLTAALFGLATAGWAYVGRHADAPSWTAISFLGPAMLVLLMRPRAAIKLRPFLQKELMKRMLALGIIFSVSAVSSLLAYRDGNVNVIAALQQTGVIVTTLLAVVFLHERTHLLRKGLAAAVGFVAVLLIV